MTYDSPVSAKLAAMASLADAAWVLAAKDLFAEWRPTVSEAIDCFGARTNQAGGGIFITPLDGRFQHGCVSQRSKGDEGTVPLGLLAVGGPAFSVRPAELTDHLPLLEKGYNTYDGGLFFFFHPLLPNPGGLGGIQLKARDEDVRGSPMEGALASTCHYVSFHFGEILTRYRDGLACEDPEVAFEGFARRWFTALAEHRDADAMAALAAPNSYGVSWTPDSIRAAITRHGAREVTRPEESSGEPKSSVVALADGTGWSHDHDVPLDGAWSDLTAQFEFLRRGSGLAVALHDLHVM